MILWHVISHSFRVSGDFCTGQLYTQPFHFNVPIQDHDMECALPDSLLESFLQSYFCLLFFGTAVIFVILCKSFFFGRWECNFITKSFWPWMNLKITWLLLTRYTYGILGGGPGDVHGFQHDTRRYLCMKRMLFYLWESLYYYVLNRWRNRHHYSFHINFYLYLSKLSFTFAHLFFTH